MVDRPMPIVNNCIHGGLRNRFPRLKMFLNRHRGSTMMVHHQVKFRASLNCFTHRDVTRHTAAIFLEPWRIGSSNENRSLGLLNGHEGKSAAVRRLIGQLTARRDEPAFEP
jgi:hypothetical protein